MKTKQRESSENPGLPPPPAPTSRNANPWSISAQTGRSQAGPAAPRPLARHPKASHAPRAPHVPGMPRKADGPIQWIPVVILLFVMGAALATAVQLLSAGDVAGALGPLFAAGFAAMMALRWVRKRRQ